MLQLSAAKSSAIAFPYQVGYGDGVAEEELVQEVDVFVVEVDPVEVVGFEFVTLNERSEIERPSSESRALVPRVVAIVSVEKVLWVG